MHFGRLGEPEITINWEQRSIQSEHPTEEIGTLDKLLLLFNTPCLQSMNPEALVDMAKEAIVKIYGQGEKICHEGDPPEKIFILIRHSAHLHIPSWIFTFSKRLVRKTFILEVNINKFSQ